MPVSSASSLCGLHARRGEHEVTVDRDAVVQLHRTVMDGLDRDPADVPCTCSSDQPAQPFAGLGTQPLVLRHSVRRDQRDRNTPPGKGSRRLTADETGADHDRGSSVDATVAQALRIGQRAQLVGALAAGYR